MRDVRDVPARVRGTRVARLARASAMPVEHTWWEAGVRCSLFSGGSIRFGSNAGWQASLAYAPAHTLCEPMRAGTLETRATRQMLCAGTETSPPVLLTLPVLTRWTIHPVRLRLASVSVITVSFVVWKESWRRAQRCGTSSARSDNQTSSCIPLGRFGTTTIHDIGGQAWVAPCPACGKAEAARELSEAAILAPLVPLMTARASGAPSSSGSPRSGDGLHGRTARGCSPTCGCH